MRCCVENSIYGNVVFSSGSLFGWSCKNICHYTLSKSTLASCETHNVSLTYDKMTSCAPKSTSMERAFQGFRGKTQNTITRSRIVSDSTAELKIVEWPSGLESLATYSLLTRSRCSTPECRHHRPSTESQATLSK